MTAARVAAAALAAGVALGALAPAARADRSDRAERADQLFKKGKRLLAEKKYAEACGAFEQSDRIDPEIGAKLNVARCYQEWGKLATAWRWFSDAEQLAIKAGDDRAKKIHGLIEDLDRDVPRLALRLPPGAELDRVVIRLDGVEVAAAALGDARRVDPGPHRIEITVDGAPRTKLVPVEHGTTDVVLDVPVRSVARSTTPAAPARETEAPPDPGRNRRLLGLGVSSVGVVAMGIAGIATLRARSDYQHAIDGYCNGASDMCDETGLSRTHSARHRANIATAVTLGGLAAVAGGVFLYVTAPAMERRDEHALYVAPTVGGDATGLVLGGAF